VAPHASAISISTQTFEFTGACIDCTGTATASLVLQNYTLGNGITNSNFVSFTYNPTDLIPAGYVISTALNNFESINGVIPANLPGVANVSILGVVYYFNTDVSGNWETGVALLNNDFGVNGAWSPQNTGVPEPSAVVLMGSAALALLGVRRGRRS